MRAETTESKDGMASKWIWPFELQEKIGEGGMGVVYRARYVGNDRIVAVKLLPDDVAQNPTLVARFDRELEILTQLKHRNIVHCFGGTTESKQRFYAMELVEGGTLADVLRSKGRLSWDYVVEYGIQMCAALQHAHEKGVVHRDVKPANFLLNKAGKLKLSDFGLATIVAGQRLTMAGRTAGTFLYMAPEQIRGKPPITNRTDLYALGCVFYELLTGHPPFQAEAPAEVLHKHLKEIPPRVAKSMLDCPRELDDLVADLLQKDPELRPASAAAVGQRLESILRPSIGHVDPFARTPSASVAQVVTSTPQDSDEIEMTSVSKTPSSRLVRGLSAAVVLLSCCVLWDWWTISEERRLREVYAQSWLTAATTAGDGQIPALQQMARLPELPGGSIETLMQLVESEQLPQVRVAALQTLQQHPERNQTLSSRLLVLEKNEPEMSVRMQMGATRQALENEKGASSTGWGGYMRGLLGLLTCVAVACWVYEPAWLGLRGRK